MVSIINILQKICSEYAKKYNVQLNDVKAHIYYSQPPNQLGTTEVMIRVKDENKELVTNEKIKQIAIPEIKKNFLASFFASSLEKIDFLEQLGLILKHYADKEKANIKEIEGLIYNLKKKDTEGFKTLPIIFKNKTTELERLTDEKINKIIKL